MHACMRVCEKGGCVNMCVGAWMHACVCGGREGGVNVCVHACMHVCGGGGGGMHTCMCMCLDWQRVIVDRSYVCTRMPVYGTRWPSNQADGLPSHSLLLPPPTHTAVLRQGVQASPEVC